MAGLFGEDFAEALSKLEMALADPRQGSSTLENFNLVEYVPCVV